MPSPRYLTKSRFKLAVDCPTKLFYCGKGNTYRDAMAESDFLAMLAEGGYQVGALAKLRYDSSVWQDVYHAPCPNKKVAYIKLTLRGGAVVIQFKEK